MADPAPPSYQSVNQYGAAYKFGVDGTDAPNIAGFAFRSAQFKFAPEVNEVALDGEGHGESQTVSKPEKRMITATFTGYVLKANYANVKTVADFTFDARFYVVQNVSAKGEKGKYFEVEVEAESRAGVTSSTSGSSGSGS